MVAAQTEGDADNSAPRSISLLIVEDEVALGNAWRRILSRFGCDVAVANSLAQAAELLGGGSFDVILLDLVLTDGQGSDLLPRIHALRPRPAIAIISGYVDSARVLALHGQADIILPKPIEADELQRLITTLEPRSRPVGEYAVGFCEQHRLSPRETDVIQGAARGLQNKEIAAQLGCKVATVVTYWRRIFSKTGTRSRAEVLSLLLDCGARACSGCPDCPKRQT